MVWGRFLIVLTLISLLACSNQTKQEIFAIKMDSKDTIIDLRKLKPDHVFSIDFLNYLVYKFPTASNAIFYQNDSLDYGIKLNDTAYVFGMISISKKVFLLNSLPKDLSKKESENYFNQPGLFIYEDSADLALQDSLFNERTKWTQAPTAIQDEYLKFFKLLKSDNEFMLIVPKSFINAAPW